MDDQQFSPEVSTDMWLFSKQSKHLKEGGSDDIIEQFVALKEQSTARQYSRVCKEFIQWLGGRGKKIDACTDADALQFATVSLNKPGAKRRFDNRPQTVTRATVLRKCIILREFWIASFPRQPNPFDAPCKRLARAKTGEKRPTESMSVNQVRELLEAPSPRTKEGVRDRAILAVIFGGGLRRSEAAGLRLSDVRRVGGDYMLMLGKTKGGTGEEQFVPDWVGEKIDRLIKQRNAEAQDITQPLFVTYSRGVPRERQISCETLYRVATRWCAELGFPPIYSPHSARATYCTQLLEAGNDYNSVRECMRHKSVMMVQKYDRRVKSRLQSVARNLRYE